MRRFRRAGSSRETAGDSPARSPAGAVADDRSLWLSGIPAGKDLRGRLCRSRIRSWPASASPRSAMPRRISRTTRVHRAGAARLGLGISQSGRFLRHFVAAGFNADESGRQVFDGLFVHVAGAGIGSFNHRFAQPSRDAQPVSALVYPTDLFPFTDLPETGSGDGRRRPDCSTGRGREVAPKIFTTNTSYEYWGRAGLARRDVSGRPAGRVAIPAEVRALFPRGPAALHRDLSSERGTFPRIASVAPAESESDRRGCGGPSSTTWRRGSGRRRAAGEPLPERRRRDARPPRGAGVSRDPGAAAAGAGARGAIGSISARAGRGARGVRASPRGQALRDAGAARGRGRQR